MEDFIAAIFPSLLSSAVGDSSFSEGSDNSFASVSASPHIKSKHLIWDCLLTGPKVNFPVTKPALIDNGCHMVLIRPDIIHELGLDMFTLDQPEQVNIAISFSKSGIIRNNQSLVQYVKIHPFSKDSMSKSCLLHAVVCLCLCMPLILASPF